LISNTPTPAPNTIWGRLYTGLEIFAGFYNRAKDIGIPVPEKPSVGDLLARIQELESSLQTQQQDKRSVPLPQAAIAVPVPVPTFPPILEQSNA
jgi:hypothetical protein